MASGPGQDDCTLRARLAWGNPPVDRSLYIGSADALFKAQVLFGVVPPKTLDACERGNGMIVSWQRDKGESFTAANYEWVASLIDSQLVLYRAGGLLNDHEENGSMSDFRP